MDYWLIFITGLTVGGLTCITIQGGLLTSAITARVGQHKKISFLDHFLAISIFLVAKFLGYFFLGLMLGTVGEALTWNDTMIIIVQILAGLYMIGLALHFLRVHPIFRILIPKHPDFLDSLVSKESKSKSFFAPFVLGLITIFVPCGTTIAMEALAMSTGDPWLAASVMGVFVIGTFPLFLVLGIITTSAGIVFKKNFNKIAAILILILGLNLINNSLVVMDFPITMQKLYYSQPLRVGFFEPKTDIDNTNGKIIEGKQFFNIKVTNSGYEPRYIKVKKNVPVILNLTTKGAYSCALAFRIPPLKIAKNLKPNSVESVEFVINKSGKTYFSCSMGMYIGIIEVID